MPGFTARADVAARRSRVLALRIEQRPYAEIAAELGISESTARTDYGRSLEQDATAATARNLELAKLDLLEQAAWRVLRARHITVQHGKIVGKYAGPARVPETGELVRDEDGKPIPVYEEIEDDAPILNAIDRLVRIAARRATLTGMDAPTRIEVDDARRAEIERLAAELAAAAGVADVDPGRTGTAAGDAAAGQVGTPAP
jgi:DNA-binding CsgD family transcriptional regulator